MAKDVLITPAQGRIDFDLEAFIYYDSSDLIIGFSNPSIGLLTQKVRINDDLLIDGCLFVDCIGGATGDINFSNSTIVGVKDINIGDACNEGSYTGLFSFTTETTVGCAVDQLNDVLAALAPPNHQRQSRPHGAPPAPDTNAPPPRPGCHRPHNAPGRSTLGPRSRSLPTSHAARPARGLRPARDNHPPGPARFLLWHILSGESTKIFFLW